MIPKPISKASLEELHTAALSAKIEDINKKIKAVFETSGWKVNIVSSRDGSWIEIF